MKHHLIKLYDDWLPVKEVFKRPKLRVYFGRWIKDPCLPMWRRGICNLPILFSFYIFNRSMMWKPKYEEYRFEFPPQFTIVFFGLSLSFWLDAPKTPNIGGTDDNYWEALLIYKDKNNLKETIEGIGIWKYYDKKGSYEFFGVRPEFINKEYLEQYYSIVSNLNNKLNTRAK